MVNPRQRSKKRSGSHKPVRHSKRAKKMLKKQPPIRGPKVLQDAWDKHKTVKQNYVALGLVSSLNPIASGGTERQVLPPQSSNNQSITEPSTPQTSGSGARIPRGRGRITKDMYGNVIDIELGEDEDETVQRNRDNKTYELDHTPLDGNLMNWVQLGTNHRPPRSDGNSVVQELQNITESVAIRAIRFLSDGERSYIERLVARHKDDFGAMAKDRKLNPEQRTAGELTRAIRRAGGVDKLVQGV